MKHIKIQNEIDFSPNSIIYFAVFDGYKDDEDLELLIQGTLPLKYLNLRRGWELKEVLTMPLPEKIRYMVLKQWEQRVKEGHLAFALFCR